MTPSTGPIPERLDGAGRADDRRNTRLATAWLLRERADPPPSTPTLVRDAHTPVPITTDRPVLVVLTDEVPAVAESARAAIQAGARVYCLAPAEWAGADAPDWLGNASPTSALIRRVREAPMAAVIADRQGWLWIGPHGPGQWRLTLDPDQVEAARRVFLDLFWNRADDEAWAHAGKLQWRDRGDPPFDVPAPLPAAPVRLKPSNAQPEPLTSEPDGFVYAPDGRLPDLPARRIWVPPSGERHEEFAAAHRRGTEVVWADLGLPACVTAAPAGATPSTNRWSLHIFLNSAQADALDQVLRLEPDATFRTALTLGEAELWLDHAGKVWRGGQAQPAPLIDEQELDAGMVRASSLRDMPATTPTSWPNPAPLALSVRWRWQVSPPRAPAGAVDDPLVRAWRATDNGYMDRVASALATLADLEKQEEELRRSFPTSRGSVLGFQRSRETLAAELRGCQAVVPSEVGPEPAVAQLARLSDLETRVDQLVEQVAEAERQAREQEERRRQEREHNEMQQRARKDLADHAKEFGSMQQRLDELDTKLGKLATQATEVADMPKKDRKDLRAQRHKISSERTHVERRIPQLERLIEQAQTLIDKAFEYKPVTRHAPKKQAGATFVPAAGRPPDRPIPDEALPKVGRLLRVGKDRLLAISRWEDLDPGESEASRLNARLVADATTTPKDVTKA